MRTISLFLLIMIVIFFGGCTAKTNSGDSQGKDLSVATGNTGETDKGGAGSQSDGVQEKSSTSKESKGPQPTIRTLPPGIDGEISYLEGSVRVSRDGSFISPVAVGTGIQNYDFIKTGGRSSAEVEVISKRAPGSVITISENTSFTFELNKTDSKNSTSIDMLTGSIALKVKSLAGSQDMIVRTGETTLGVRGTTFKVTCTSEGDVLVTCKEGKVECFDTSDGKTAFAVPGTAVERGTGSTLAGISLAVKDIDSFEKKWFDDKLSFMRKHALERVSKYAAQYKKRIGRFNQEYSSLLSESDVIEKWRQEEKAGKIGSTIDILKEKKRIIAHFYKLRKELFWLERAYYRLLVLKTYLSDENGNIEPGVTSKAFFDSLSSDDLENKLAQIRFLHKLYAKRNDGSVPLESVDDL
jgi:hypothetical protein